MQTFVEEEKELGDYEPETFAKAADHVQIYMKEIGPFPLLTREGEVEMCTKDRKWKAGGVAHSAQLPSRYYGGYDLGNALHAGTTTIKEVTNEIDDEEWSLDEEQVQKKRVLNLINRIQRGENAFECSGQS